MIRWHVVYTVIWYAWAQRAFKHWPKPLSLRNDMSCIVVWMNAACECDDLGSSSPLCDAISGQCPCRENVATESQLTRNETEADTRCSLCASGYYGLASGNGCIPCDCHGNGSSSSQCSDDTGECICKDTVTGTQCDECRPGFFMLTADGCL